MATKRKKLNGKSGFGTIEVIIAMCILLMIILVGFIIWQKNHSGQNKNTAPSSENAKVKVTDTTLSNVPVDLRDFILADAKQVYPMCTVDVQKNSFEFTNNTTVSNVQPLIHYSSNNLAYTITGCKDTTLTYEFLVKEKSIWQKADQHGDGKLFKCTSLKHYMPSLKLLGAPNGINCSLENYPKGVIGQYDGKQITTLNLNPPSTGQ